MLEEQNKKRILVIEDEAFLRDLYIEILSDAGFTVESAIDGQEGLKKIQQGGYDLILLDIVLPKMDGIEILKALKNNPPANPNGSIVMLTNLGQEAVISEGVSLGVRGHIIKSDYTPEQLVNEVKHLLSS